NGKGGTGTLKLGDAPVQTHFVRIWMTQSSNTPDIHGAQDIRNCVGYAIQTINVGAIIPGGEFVDAFPITTTNAAATTRPAGIAGRKHWPTFCVSSIDPWHSAADIVSGGGNQHSGFDLFFTSGLTNNLPAMIPVTLLYGTPDDAAAQIAYIEKRGYRIGWIEMGEEPDGKHTLPEDYAALYIQWATAIHKVDPKLKLGGPIFEGVTEDITVWPDAQSRTSWMGRFVDYLKAHGRISDLAFVSFEHYPFDGNITWNSLYQEPQLMQHILQVWRADGVPKNVPLKVTESSIAAELVGQMSQIYAALWLSDSIGSFFAAGGSAYFHSPIQPQPVSPGRGSRGSASWSNFVSDKNYNITGYTSFYWAAHMINLEWVQHRSGVHQMFPSTTGITDNQGNTLVTSYAVLRPDGNWSLLLVNRDEDNPH
ncbi:MAG TPA: glycosyl hydrolase family 5, partial [Phycisphaerae bacterium]|nr:glycosyl hydrolase family 5 [Phycisphaerae bacterium]